MKIEIWSDVMCPFCYIGKRKFETALEKFSQKNQVEIVWKSFQLNPDMEYTEGDTLNKYLSRHNGWTEEYARSANEQVTGMAKESGLEFNLEKAIPANTLKAHRLIHLAAKSGLQDKAEETLFSAYFTEGKNVGDTDTLIALGKKIGLSDSELKDLFERNKYINEVETDILEAQQIGVRGVPFFVIDRKYAISGAQPSDVFLRAMEKAFTDSEIPSVTNTNGESCDVEGKC